MKQSYPAPRGSVNPYADPLTGNLRVYDKTNAPEPAWMEIVEKAWDLAIHGLVGDTETSGTSASDQVCEISIVSPTGKPYTPQELALPIQERPMPSFAPEVIFRERVRMTVPMSEGAYRVHGISDEDLRDAPEWETVLKHLKEVVGAKTLVWYNADFDSRLIRQTCQAHWIPEPDWSHQCLMKGYAIYRQSKGKPAKWVKLMEACAEMGIAYIQAEAHAADYDALVTARLLKAIARGE